MTPYRRTGSNDASPGTHHSETPTTPYREDLAQGDLTRTKRRRLEVNGFEEPHNLPTRPSSSFFNHSHHNSFHNLTVNAVGGDQINCTEETGLKLLYQEVSQIGAFHDSEARFPPPRCHPETRKAVLADISAWIIGQETDSQSITPKPTNRTAIHWLYGSAGVGKSAIAQTLAEHFGDSHLSASFFFSRLSPGRNSPRSVFATIAYSLAMRGDADLRAAIDKAIIANNKSLGAFIENQFQELVVRPLRSLPREKWKSLPKLVIIDGLDECQGSDSQRRILTTILDQLVDQNGKPGSRIPLRFLIASRPEPQIRDVFNNPRYVDITTRTEIGDNHSASRDIEIYLHDGFDRIVRNHDAMKDKFLPWPSAGVVHDLVQRASGQFIYASTVMKYVEDEYSHPEERLKLVLGLPVGDPDAFSDLDALYRQIMSSNTNKARVLQILGAYYCFVDSFKRPTSHPQVPIRRCPSKSIAYMENLLGLPSGTIFSALRGMHSVLEIEPDSFTFRHKSFTDFLLDERRSGNFFLDIPVYHEGLARRCIKMVDTISLPPPHEIQYEYIMFNFVRHIKGARITTIMVKELKNFNFCQYARWFGEGWSRCSGSHKLSGYIYLYNTLIGFLLYFTNMTEILPEQMGGQIKTWSDSLKHAFYIQGLDENLHLLPDVEVLSAFIMDLQDHFPWSSPHIDILAYLGYDLHIEQLPWLMDKVILCHPDWHPHVSNLDWRLVDIQWGHHSLTKSCFRRIRSDPDAEFYLRDHVCLWSSHLCKSRHELDLVEELVHTIEFLSDTIQLQEAILWLQEFPERCHEARNATYRCERRIATIENGAV